MRVRPANKPPKGGGIWGTMDRLSKLLHASMRPLPTETGDFSYITAPQETGLLQDLENLDMKDYETVIRLFKNAATGDLVNDRTYEMENIIRLASSLPSTSQNRVILTNMFLSQLWHDIVHPPPSYLGTGTVYRAADGSGQIVIPRNVGAAGSCYAKTVQPKSIQPSSRPDAGLLFDSIMARECFKPHPGNISSMMFCLATLIIHDCFRTDHRDPCRTLTSSYLDLSPLYGCNQAEQNTIRTFRDGKIKADCFTDTRLYMFPPGVGVLVIMFNRFHNHVVQNLAAINENGRFTKPDDVDSKAYVKYDNDLFQTARLITCGLYVNVLLKDYVRTILNIQRTQSDWSLDPRAEVTKTFLTEELGQALGNQVSVEFNLAYRWHSCVSELDDKWTQGLFKKLFPGEDVEQLTLPKFVRRLAEWEASLPESPQERGFADLERLPNGTFNDDDLVGILNQNVESVAGAFGARNIPKIFRAVEVLGIERARSWNLATLNEFRKHFHLTPYTSFEEINPDPEVSNTLKHLYDHPDNVELYPGLVVEDTKAALVPGSGLCATFTLSRAILADAVALVRGDRHCTLDYTPWNLTNWGYEEANHDVAVDNGHVFYKLFLRAFPHHYEYNSVYAHFPLVTPSENKEILSSLGLEEKYSWKKPGRLPMPSMVFSHAACKTILENKQDFKVTWGKTIQYLMQRDGKPYGKDFMLSGDGTPNECSRKMLSSALYINCWRVEVSKFYEATTLELLRSCSYKIAGVNQVDIVRDVLNIAQVRFCAKLFSLPLKSEDNPHGIYTDAELYMVMAVVFTCIFYNVDPVKSFKLREVARKLTQDLGELVMLGVRAMSGGGLLGSVLDKLRGKKDDGLLPSYGVHMMQRLLKSGVPPDEVIWTHMLPTAGGMVANQAQLISQCLDYYLSEEGAEHLPRIQLLAQLDTPECDEVLKRYFLEGARLRSTVALYRDVENEAIIDDDGNIHHLKPSQRVVCNLVTASKDPSVYPDPHKVRLDRDIKSYIFLGIGPHQCLGYDLCITGLTTMLKTIAKLGGLRRAPGSQGQLKKIVKDAGITAYMTADEKSYFPFPTTMKVQWDGEI